MLPERLLALAEKIVQQAGNVVGQRVSVQIVLERVVAVVSVQADLGVVFRAAVLHRTAELRSALPPH